MESNDMDQETKEDYQSVFASLQTFALRIDAMRQEQESKNETTRLDKACNLLSAAVDLVREAWEIIENDKWQDN